MNNELKVKPRLFGQGETLEAWTVIEYLRKKVCNKDLTCKRIEVGADQRSFSKDGVKLKKPVRRLGGHSPDTQFGVSVISFNAREGTCSGGESG